VSQICEKDQDINVIFNSKGFIVERSGAKLLEGRLAGGLYLLDEINQHEANVVEISDKLRTWHERLGHLSISNMKMLAEQIEDKDVRKELDAITTDTKIECVACDQGKMARRKIPKKNDLEIKEIGDVTYSDLSGKISPESRGGMQYYATFTDGKSRYSTIYFLRKKSEAIQKFKEYWNTLNTQKGIRLKKLVTDEGSEYCNKEFEEFCKKKGIKHVVTPPYTPQKNGVSERLNRTLMDKARSMMKAKNVGLTSWAEAVNHANYLRNLSPTQKLKKMTPYEVFHNEKPDLSMLRTFGCRVFIKNNAHKKKLANRSVVGVLMGIQDRNYRIWNIKRKAIELSRDVIFYEKEGDERSQEEEIEYDQVVESEEESTTTASSTKTTTISSESSASSESESSETSESSKESSEASKSSKESESSEESESPKENESSETSKDEEEKRSLKIGTRVSYKFKIGKTGTKSFEGEVTKIHSDNTYDVRFKEDGLTEERLKHKKLVVVKNTEVIKSEPTTWDEMMNSKDRDKWLEAVNAEINSLNNMNTWTIINKEPNQKLINSKWIFKIKYKPDGEIERYKARLVAKGFMQKEGIDYGETFAPVVRTETLRFLISFATQQKLEMEQMDVETAFLHGELEEEVLMKIPTGINIESSKVLKLNKSLYGLKQSPRCWNKKFTQALKAAGYIQSEADNCLFVKYESKRIAAIAIYVDDCILIGSQEDVLKIKKVLTTNFKMKDLGRLAKIIGIEIIRTDEFTKIHQAGYIRDLLDRFQMTNAAIATTPGSNNREEDKSSALEKIEVYQSLVGSLIYISTKTRPDIAFAVHEIAKKMSNPTQNDWVAAKLILRYLRGTEDTGLIYHVDSPGRLIGYADASFAPNRTDRKSIGGYLFLLNGAAITWKSKKQNIIALSSCEAELIALTEAVKEGIWLQKILKEFRVTQKLHILEDNQSAMKIAENSVFSDRSKHLQVRVQFIKEMIDTGKLGVFYCPTQEMTADVLTKALGRVLHQRHMVGLGMTTPTTQMDTSTKWNTKK
jgi:transposase InsO family protein